MDNQKYWIWLSRIENLSPIKKLELVKKFKNLETIYNLDKQEVIKNGFSEKDADKITNIIYKKDLEKYEDYMRKNDIKIIDYFNPKYPKNLRQIYDPPITLFVKGNENILNEYGLAIVGCRNCSEYGEYVAKKIAYGLGINNINVISGLARGIDSFSHIGSLQAKGKTIAVVRMWFRYSIS